MIHSFDFPLSPGYAAGLVRGTRGGANGFVRKLEQMLEAHAVVTDSGLDAIRLFLRAVGLRPGDEIFIPGYICYYVVAGLMRDGYALRLVDIDENYRLSSEDLLRKISRKTKAVIVPHMFGIPSDIAAIRAIAAAHGAAVLEDSAQSFCRLTSGGGPTLEGDAAILSFGLTKPAMAVGGGALIAKNADLISAAGGLLRRHSDPGLACIKLAKFALYANRDLFYLIAEKHHWEQRRGEGGQDPIVRRFGDIQGIIGSASLSVIHALNGQRIENAHYLQTGLSHLPIIFPAQTPGWPLLRLPVRVRGADQARTVSVMRSFVERGVLVEMPYPCIQELLGVEIDCPRAKMMADTTLALPVHPNLSRSRLDRIVEIFGEACDSIAAGSR